MVEYETKWEDKAQRIIERGFRQINKELNELYKQSTDQNNWFYVGSFMANPIAEGVKLLSENFGFKQLPKNVADKLLNK